MSGLQCCDPAGHRRRSRARGRCLLVVASDVQEPSESHLLSMHRWRRTCSVKGGRNGEVRNRPNALHGRKTICPRLPGVPMLAPAFKISDGHERLVNDNNSASVKRSLGIPRHYEDFINRGELSAADRDLRAGFMDHADPPGRHQASKARRVGSRWWPMRNWQSDGPFSTTTPFWRQSAVVRELGRFAFLGLSSRDVSIIPGWSV